MSARWVHFSDRPVEVAGWRPQRELISSYVKPDGLWLSDENAETSWSAWCRDNDFRNTNAQVAHAVTLDPGAWLLHLGSMDELVDFSRRYRREGKYGWGIDWQRVAMGWAGLLITPYVWDCRLNAETEWYYGWDCASGCIWEPEAIASISVLAPDWSLR